MSNYTVDHLEELLQFASVVPAVLQVRKVAMQCSVFQVDCDTSSSAGLVIK